MIRWVGTITDSMNMRLSKLQEMVSDREAWHAAAHGVTGSWTDLVTEQHQHSSAQKNENISKHYSLRKQKKT